MQTIKKYNKLYPVISFVFGIFLLIVSFSFLDIIGDNNKSILRGDLTQQYVAFIRDFLNSLRGESSYWYSFANYFGSGNVLNNAYYAINPFNLLYLIYFDAIETITTIIIFTKMALAAATFEFFVQKHLDAENPFFILISVFYALSGFSVIMHFNMMWLDIVYILPIIIHLILKLIDEGKFLALTLVYAYTFITNFYMGFMAGVFSAVVYVVYILYKNDFVIKGNVKKYIYCSVKYFVAVVIAIGISAFLLIPTFCFLMSHMAADNFAFDGLSATIFDFLNAFFVGQMPTLDNKVPFIYCGIPVFALFLLFFFKKNIDKKIKISFGVITLFYFICMIFLPAYKFMHAFDYPNFYAYRFSFAFIFLICFMGCYLIKKLDMDDFKVLKIFAIVSVVFYSFMMTFQQILYGIYNLNTQNGLLINAVFVFLWLLVAYIYLFKKDAINGKKRILAIAFVILLVSSEIVTNTYLCISKQDFNPLTDSEFNQIYFSEKEAIDSIVDDSFYRVHVDNEWIQNAGKLFNYNSLSTFSSSDNYELRMALSNLGLSTANRSVICHSLLPGFDSLFSVKYVVYLPDYEMFDSATITEDNFIRATVETRPYALSLGYMSNAAIKDYTFEPSTFRNVENLANTMSGLNETVYEEISYDDMNMISNNVEVVQGSDYFVLYPLSDGFRGGYVEYSYEDEGKDIYCDIYQEAPECTVTAPSVGAEDMGCLIYPFTSMGGIYKLQADEDGYRRIYLSGDSNSKLNTYIKNLTFATYNEEGYKRIYDELSQNQYIITHNQGDVISGTICATEDKTVMFTSIPYDPEWYVYVDGQRAEVLKLVGAAFMGVELTPGEHTVTFVYVEPYYVQSIVISFVFGSLYIVLVLFNLYRRYKKNK